MHASNQSGDRPRARYRIVIYELFQGRTEKLATYTGDVYHVVVSNDETTRRLIYHRTGGDPETANALAQLIADNPIDPQL
jgi:hypothetical protein